MDCFVHIEHLFHNIPFFLPQCLNQLFNKPQTLTQINHGCGDLMGTVSQQLLVAMDHISAVAGPSLTTVILKYLLLGAVISCVAASGD